MDRKASTSEGVERVLARLTADIAAKDKAAAVAGALDAVRDGVVDVPTLYGDVLVPVLIDTGAAWQHRGLRIWEEHLATATVRTIVECLYPMVQMAKAESGSRPGATGEKAGSVLLACPPEEAHDLGLRMLADLLELAGWRVHYLGPDTPVDELIDAARALDVDAIGLSLSTHFHRLWTRHTVQRLKTALPGVQVWAGGPGLAHGAESIGADPMPYPTQDGA